LDRYWMLFVQLQYYTNTTTENQALYSNITRTKGQCAVRKSFPKAECIDIKLQQREEEGFGR